MRRTLAATALTLALVGLSTGTALADDGDYTPDTPPTSTLAGSSASSYCADGVPRIDFNVVLTDPGSTTSSHKASLILTDGSTTHTVPLGTLKNNKLSGSILWPGASVDGSGNGTGWPGWIKTNDGDWVQTAGNFAWTRGDITATLHVNPAIDVALAYPSASAGCANPTAVSAEDPGASELAITGGPVSLAAAGAGVAALVAGLVITLRRRRAQH